MVYFYRTFSLSKWDNWNDNTLYSILLLLHWHMFLCVNVLILSNNINKTQFFSEPNIFHASFVSGILSNKNKISNLYIYI